MRFSVIVPVFNVVDYVSVALDSLLLQDFKDWEAICVDDGSTDGSGDVLDRYAKRDSRIKVIHVKNAGVSAARNRAMDAAIGEYFVFLDADDAYVINAFSYLNTVIAKYRMPDLIAYSSLSFTEHRSHYKVECSSECVCYNMNNDNDLRQAIHRCLGDLIAWNGCVRRNAINGLMFHSYPNGEDVLWGAECLMRVENMLVTNACLYRYLYRDNSALRTISYRHAESAVRVSREMINKFAQWPKSIRVRPVIFRRLLAQHLGYTRAILNKIPFRQRRGLRRQFLSTLKFLCNSDALVIPEHKRFLRVAASFSLFRVLFLYIPFKMYALQTARK